MEICERTRLQVHVSRHPVSSSADWGRTDVSVHFPQKGTTVSKKPKAADSALAQFTTLSPPSACICAGCDQIDP